MCLVPVSKSAIIRKIHEVAVAISILTLVLGLLAFIGLRGDVFPHAVVTSDTALT